MTTYFDETYAKVWADASVPCVYTAIERPPSADEFNLIARHQLSTVIQINKSKVQVFSITDFTGCRGLSKEDAIAYMTNIVEREFRLGVTHKLFIRSHDKMTRDSFIHGLVAAASLNFYVCDTFAEALKEINSIKQNPLAVQPKSTLPSLIRLIRDIFSWRPLWKVTPAK